ncbi:MAG: purine-nucleoside phosphorylase [Bacteroidetes bacterium]|nr:purine-nucleoside phosphorylase [Bacteroidota bacterium]
MEKIYEALTYLKSRGIVYPDTGIILGTGLGKMVKHLHVEQSIHYSEIPHFPVSTVEFHNGTLLYGKMEGKQVIAMHGRFHYYEGYTLKQITFPIRVMKLLGIQRLLISNAGGSMNPEFKKGTLMLLDDHINLLPDNPLIGHNYDELGPRFPDMSEPYSQQLNDQLIQIAAENNITLHKGVYVAVAGPNLETRAEYRYLRTIGADVVGMSTVPEVIVANHMKLPCAAISVITDECDPDNLKPICLKDLLETAAVAEDDLIVLIRELLRKI